MRWNFWQKPVLVIDIAVDDDLPALADIHEAGFPHAWDAEAIAGIGSRPGARLWVARLEGRAHVPVGFALVRHTAGEGEVITIATGPQFRRLGVARALMGHVIRELQAERAERLFLEVSEQNLPALNLYRDLGFRQVGRREGYYRSPAPGIAPAGALVMQLDLR